MESSVLVFGTLGIIFLGILIISTLLAILFLICQWKIFKKAGEPGWKSIIPIYNTYIYLKICGIGAWFLIFFLLPLIPVEELQTIFTVISGIASIYSSYKLSKAFGYGLGFTLGIIFLPIIFLPILAFNNSEYNLNETL